MPAAINESDGSETFPWDGFVQDYRNTIIEHLRAHTEGTNVNSKTLLTTDYLNHHNEAVMLLELLPTAPEEIAAELAEWQHEDYEEHMLESGFRDKALAIAGYRNAPQGVRHAFDAKIESLEEAIVGLLRDVQELVEAGNSRALSERCAATLPQLRSMIAEASAIVNGEYPLLLVKGGESTCETTDAQAKIDALFD